MNPMTGKEIIALMRKNHMTIRQLSERLDVPMTRVRWAREHGLNNAHAARDWVEAITEQYTCVCCGESKHGNR